MTAIKPPALQAAREGAVLVEKRPLAFAAE